MAVIPPGPIYDDDGRAVAMIPENRLRRCPPTPDVGWTIHDDMLYEDGEFRGVVTHVRFQQVPFDDPKHYPDFRIELYVAVHVENPLECRDDDEQ